jgi:hypothetical protein
MHAITASTIEPSCLINTSQSSAVCTEPPKIKPSNSANTGQNSVRTPARSSVTQVTHKAVGQQDQQRRRQREISTGRVAPGMTPWKARTGIDNSSQLRPSTITKNPASGRRATQLLNLVDPRDAGNCTRACSQLADRASGLSILWHRRD